jgi:hypothetical protein
MSSGLTTRDARRGRERREQAPHERRVTKRDLVRPLDNLTTLA